MKPNNLVSIYLPPDLSFSQISDTLQIPLKKGIESTYYAQLTEDRFLFFTQFDVITFVNWQRADIVTCLKQLAIQNASHFETHMIFQDYQIQTGSTEGFKVSNEAIELEQLDLWPLMIVALVISQSVGLEKYEKEVDSFFAKGRQLLENASRLTWLRRKQFSDYAKELSLVKHDMVLDLMLLDKPNILWDNSNYEALYNQLAQILEIQERFEVVGYKLNTLKEDIAMMMDLYNHIHSSFLEWIIIWLIVIEVIMGLWEHFFQGH